MSRRLRLLVNPAAAGGRSLRSLARARAALEAAGADFRVEQTTGLDHARELAAEAAERGEAIVAVGGDGLVGALAGVLCDGPVPLAIVPSGRGNDFARVLGIPRDPAAAARVALDGAERLVDVAYADGKPFVGIASCGFDSDANRIANEMRLIRGDLVYLVAALRALWSWRPATFRVTVDGETTEVTGYSAAVGNSKAYGGGMYLIPHAELDDGRLDVFLSGRVPKLRFLLDVPKVFRGTHVRNPAITFLSGSEVRVEADRPFTVYADGDPIGELPITITVRRRCLRVIVPA